MNPAANAVNGEEAPWNDAEGDDVYSESTVSDGQHQALAFDDTVRPVEAAPATANAYLPMTAEAYLATVRAEAEAMPDVLVAQSPVPLGDSMTKAILGPDVAQPPAHARPSRRWTRALLSAFVRLQSRLDDCASVSDLGSRVQLDAQSWRARYWEINAPRPLCSRVMGLDHLHVTDSLKRYDREFEAIQVSSSNRAEAAKSETTPLYPLTEALSVGSRGRWLFALLAGLQRPLSPDVSATLRSILKKFCSERAEMRLEDREAIALANLFIVIMALHFGQDTTQELEPSEDDNHGP